MKTFTTTRSVLSMALALLLATSTSVDASCKTDYDSSDSAAGNTTPGDASSPGDTAQVPSSSPSYGSSYSSSSSSSANSSGTSGGIGGIVDQLAWQFKPVTSVQVRVQGNLPEWNADHASFIASFGSSFEAKYLSVTDTVNMASVEGAFKYPQAECINSDVVINCTRKNNIKYIAFYETTIAQPRAAMKYYQENTASAAAIEHCPFIPMDGGQCTPTNGTFPTECDQYTGVNGQPKLGFCVGGSLLETDYLAPYPNNYWFSYPNSCPREVWANKTAACRLAQAGGLCPFGVQPDGILCTFSYKILGYIGLDDVVGITSMMNPATNTTYANYSEFCNAGGVEYKVKTTGGKLTVEETIPFWSEPSDSARNTERVQILVDKYNALVSKSPKTLDGGVMEALPSIAELTKANPPCYQNNVQCASAKYGCRRTLYSQICAVCTEAAADCVVTPKGFLFPEL